MAGKINQSNLTLGTWAAISAGVIYGVNSNVVKVAGNLGLTTLDLIVYQFGFSIIYFLIKFIVTNKTIVTKHTWIELITNKYNLLAGITAVAVGMFYYNSIQITDPSIASLGLFQYPWILFLLGVMFNKEHITAKNIVAIILIAVGTFMLIGGSFANVSIQGLILGLFAGVSFAVYLFSLQKITDHSFTKVIVFVIATLTALVFCLINYRELNLFTVNALSYGLITAILGQILSFELLSYAAKKINSALLATLPTTELPVAMLLTWCIWGPMPNVLQILGMLVMLFAIIWLKSEKTI